MLPPAGSHPEPGLTSSAKLPVADIALSSPAIKQVGHASQYTIARQYTCAGAGHSLPLHWTGIPPGTKELAIFMLSTEPVQGKLFYDWAVAGLNPTLKGLKAGQLPPGAVLATNSTGHATYTLCPPTNKKENYLLILYALPKSLTPKPGFDPAALRAQAKAISRQTGILAGSYG